MAKNLLEFSPNTQAYIPYLGLYILSFGQAAASEFPGFSIVISIAFTSPANGFGF